MRFWSQSLPAQSTLARSGGAIGQGDRLGIRRQLMPERHAPHPTLGQIVSATDRIPIRRVIDHHQIDEIANLRHVRNRVAERAAARSHFVSRIDWRQAWRRCSATPFRAAKNNANRDPIHVVNDPRRQLEQKTRENRYLLIPGEILGQFAEFDGLHAFARLLQPRRIHVQRCDQRDAALLRVVLDELQSALVSAAALQPRTKHNRLDLRVRTAGNRGGSTVSRGRD